MLYIFVNFKCSDSQIKIIVYIDPDTYGNSENIIT